MTQEFLLLWSQGSSLHGDLLFHVFLSPFKQTLIYWAKKCSITLDWKVIRKFNVMEILRTSSVVRPEESKVIKSQGLHVQIDWSCVYESITFSIFPANLKFVWLSHYSVFVVPDYYETLWHSLVVLANGHIPFVDFVIYLFGPVNGRETVDDTTNELNGSP